MTRPKDAAARYVEIAADRFAAEGFHGVSLASIARDAGVSKQALLHFFGTKERLYGAVLRALTARLLAQVEATEERSPEAHLAEVFTRQLIDEETGDRDARLALRALLDGDARAQDWPLRPYLDRLVRLLKSSPRWSDASDQDALAAIYQVVGMVQYFAVSGSVLSGMYGVATLSDIRTSYEKQLRRSIAFLTEEKSTPASDAPTG